MSIANNIRPVVAQDVAALKGIIDASELFPSEMLEDMMSNYFDNDESQDIWLTGAIEDRSVAIAVLMQSLQWGRPPQRAASLLCA